MKYDWFISLRHRQYATLAGFTALLAFVVILLGAYTRLTNAGLSCPDWPHCYGFITAPHTSEQLATAAITYPNAPVEITKAWTEMTHRYFAGMEGLLILACVFSLLKRKNSPKSTKAVAGLLILLLGVQIALGMFTVTAKLKPVIVLSHLLTGISILSTLWWSYLKLYLRRDVVLIKHLPRHHLRWFWLALIIVFMQIALGGWVSTHSAGLACVDFPYCNGNLLPTLHFSQLNSDLISIHMLHRFGAMATAIYLTLFGIFLLKQSRFQTMGLLLLGILGLQLTLGILNILWLRPVNIALLHHATGVLLLMTVITALAKAQLESKVEAL